MTHANDRPDAMPQPLKRLYTPTLVRRLATDVAAVQRRFDSAAFVATVLGSGWARLELKQRMRRISDALAQHVRGDYPAQLDVLLRIAPGYRGLLGMFLPDFVEQHGIDDFEHSVPALRELTQYSSSELAVRPFIVRYEARMRSVMLAWAHDSSEHVRRLASEGCRPRLPWAMALPRFKADPAPILPILERLQADPSEYVRRSVANNLNDISKDHPDLVLDIARRWLGTRAETDQLVKHACRTLLKRGDQRALALFGHHDAQPVSATLRLASSTVAIGGTLDFDIVVRADAATPVRLEYRIDYVTGSGKVSSKTFKIGERELQANTPMQIARHQRFTDFTTRKHHPGSHRIAIVINGVERAARRFRVAAA